MKVLIVDDDPAIASVVQFLLELDGHEVRLAMDGPGGLGSIFRSCLSWLITDIKMPREMGSN